MAWSRVKKLYLLVFSRGDRNGRPAGRGYVARLDYTVISDTTRNATSGADVCRNIFLSPGSRQILFIDGVLPRS